MLSNQSIISIQQYLIKNSIVDNIDSLTVSAMCNKLRNSFIHMKLPVLSGIVQCDEKHFRESQKGVKNPIDVFDKLRIKRRTGRERTETSKYGTMGPEFATICCAVDGTGHSVAKVVTMGHMKLDDFEDNIAPHLKDIAFLCSDMNPIIHNMPVFIKSHNMFRTVIAIR